MKVYARAIAAISGLLVLAAPAWPSTVDDVYITLTYARHWGETGSLEWTSGERVEGYSNFLFMALMTLCATANVDIDVAAKVVAMLAGCGLVAYFSHKLPMSLSGTIPLIALVSWAPLSHWSVIGLEGTLYTALLCGGWVYTLGRPSRWGVGIALLSMASLTRPEGALHLLAGLSTHYRKVDSPPGSRWPAGAALFGLAAYHLCRYTWFGAFMPTSYLVKISPTNASPFGVYQLCGDLLTAAGIGISLLSAGRLKIRNFVWICVPLSIQALTLIRASGDWMAWSRITLPGVVTTAILYAEFATWKVSRPWLSALSLTAAVLASIFEPRGYGSIDLRVRDYLQLPYFISHFQHGIDTPVAEDVSWAIDNIPYDAKGMAVDVGILGDIPRFSLIDMRGLTHRPAAEAIACHNEEDWLNRQLANDARKPMFIRVARWSGETASDQPGWLTLGYHLAAELRYGGGIIEWFSTTDARPSVAERQERWDEVLRRHPAHPFLQWHAALSAADVGNLSRAQDLLFAGARKWPTMAEFSSSTQSVAITQSSKELRWTATRGFKAECGTKLRTRMLSANESTELILESTEELRTSMFTVEILDPCSEIVRPLPPTNSATIVSCDAPRQVDIDIQCADWTSDTLFVRLETL